MLSLGRAVVEPARPKAGSYHGPYPNNVFGEAGQEIAGPGVEASR